MCVCGFCNANFLIRVLATTRFQGRAWIYRAENDDDDDDNWQYQYKNVAFDLLIGINKNHKLCIGEQGKC